MPERRSHNLYPLLLLFLLLAGAPCLAQDTTEEVMIDTTYSSTVSVVPPNDEKTNYTDTFSASGLDAVSERSLPDSMVTKLRRSDAYWYVNEVPPRQKPKEFKERKSLLEQEWFQTLIWVIVVIAFIGAVLWYLASSNVRIFSRRARALAGTEEEPLSEDIFAIDYDHGIREAEDAGDYRLAIRLHYLKTLKEMSDAAVIQYTQERTNGDYLRQLYGTSYYRPFFRLTRDFEYAWYGQFPISSEAYGLIRQDFAHFKQQLPS